VQNEGTGYIDQASDAIEDAGEQVREIVDDTVEYVRSLDFKSMMNDVTSYVKSHPGQALIGAALVGFIAGRLVRRG
jgi:ElaB/YqjD/DUF883 family membrane-anchored ribosome-binding protein